MSFDLYRHWLAERDASFLAELLRLRPDTIHPLPPTTDALAGRLVLRVSVSRAVYALNALDLAVLELAADLGAELNEVDRNELTREASRRTSHTPASIDQSITRLVQRGVLYGDQGVRLLSEAMTSLPPQWSLLSGDQKGATGKPLSHVVEELNDTDRKILRRLALADGLGHSQDARPDADPHRPIPRLIAAGLLIRVDSEHVRLPRAVAAILRNNSLADIPLQDPLAHLDQEEDLSAQEKTDRAAAAQGLELTRRVARLIEALGQRPIALNKDGSIAARTPATLGKQLDETPAEVEQLLAFASGARLIGTGLTADVPHPLPKDANYLAVTRLADEWLDGSLAQRWADLVSGWFTSAWAPWRWERPLSEPVSHVPMWREIVLSPFTSVPRGVAVSEALARSSSLFHRPLAAADLSDEDRAGIIGEARTLGLLDGTTASSMLRVAVSAGSSISIASEQLSATASQLTPEEVRQFIIQTDLTVTVPGPLASDLYPELSLLAELEAPGLASVFRVTERSLRRALDAGRSADDMLSWLAQHALGEIPQSLTYLVNDVARRHGTLRGGAISSYIRCSDEALLAQLVGSDAAHELGLRLVAPTVAVSPQPLAAVLAKAREAGFQPVAEDEAGATVDVREEPARLYALPKVEAKRLPLGAVAPAADESRIAAAVAALQKGSRDDSTEESPDSPSVVSTIQAAIRGRRTLRIHAVSKDGSPIEASFTPLSAEGGRVDGIDETSGRALRIPLQRITNVSVM